MNKHAFYYFVGLITAYALISRLVGFFMPIYFQELGFTAFHANFHIIFWTKFSLSNIIYWHSPLPVAHSVKSVAFDGDMQKLERHLRQKKIVQLYIEGIHCHGKTKISELSH